MPLLDMIRRWLFEGHLPKSEGGRIPKGPDEISTGDFFITASPHSQGAPQYFPFVFAPSTTIAML